MPITGRISRYLVNEARENQAMIANSQYYTPPPPPENSEDLPPINISPQFHLPWKIIHPYFRPKLSKYPGQTKPQIKFSPPHKSANQPTTYPYSPQETTLKRSTTKRDPWISTAPIYRYV